MPPSLEMLDKLAATKIGTPADYREELSVAAVGFGCDPDKLDDLVDRHLEMSAEDLHPLTDEDEPPPNEAKNYAGPPAEPDPLAETDEKAIARLVALPLMKYGRVRKDEAKRLGCPLWILDRLVDQHRKTDAPDQGGLRLKPPEPWPEPVSGAALLDDIATTLRRYITADAEALNAVALWCVFAHAHDAFAISPLLAITSPAPECGKSTLLSLIGALVPKPLQASNITPAAVFRTVEKWSPTLLVDEADSFMRGNDELRGILDSGHLKASAYVIRTVGNDHEPKQFRTWCPKAIAMIGKLSATLASRAIHIQLRRATLAEAEAHEPLRIDRLDFTPLLRQAARWAGDHLDELRAADPELPDGFSGRAADNWRPIIAIADLAGGDWPERAGAAAKALAGVDKGMTRGIELLADIRTVFDERRVDRIASTTLVGGLVEMEDRPWPEWRHGKPITTTGIARLLKSFRIKPTKWKDDGITVRGYRKIDFNDSFNRYLGDQPAPAATALKIMENSEYPNATRDAAVADGNPENLNENKVVTAGAVGMRGAGEEAPGSDGEWEF